MKKQTHLIVGGSGFIGSNLANKLLSQNEEVIILDNLSRKGSEKNLDWLNSKFPNKVTFVKADITKDLDILNENIKKTSYVYHLAAQVAVTSSVENPRHDFEVNALGTLNVLESIRANNPSAFLLYSSTNKVYGGMENISVSLKDGRYVYDNLPNGLSENQLLDFHSPYGCSKGTGDQYVRDYSRIYNLNTVVFRQSCIYGTRQFGVEDQGWISWFIIALLTNKNITIYGDGNQVRDILFVDDLIAAYQLAFKNMSLAKGNIFNIGGGINNSISVWTEFKPILENLLGKKIDYNQGDWRPGDQKIYISDTSKIKSILNWEPTISPEEGIKKIFNWVKDNLNLFV